MEEGKLVSFRVADLIQSGQLVTGASSLVPSPPIASKPLHQNSRHCHKPLTPNPEILKPLGSQTPFIGTITLPSFSSSKFTISCTCFQFSDDTATVCCYVLDFDPKMIGVQIQIFSWNFIPIKCGKDGFLEITRWGFVQASSGNICFLSRASSFCWTSGPCNMTYDSKVKSFVFGIIKSVSPVFIVPCSSREGGAVNICGFLVNVLVCECKFCSSKFLVSELKNLSHENVNDHCYSKSTIVYFCGLTSSWHPVISRLIGDIVLLLMLKKKMVFIGKEESQLMYVATDNMSLHIIKSIRMQNAICNCEIRGKGECGSYTGVITGVYMQGMVVELDHDVMLLLTDQYLTVPHCMRVGAIVSLKNAHFVVPEFSWGKMLIVGACCRTSVFVESFSPLKSGCYLRSYSPSLLQNFIDSLSFSARLWVLLVISCFRRKFTGFISEREILGSKHKEGLVQKFASSHLRLSDFWFQHGVMLEFCKHDLCSGVEKAQYGHLRLVLPIANLISYCEVSWKKNLGDREECLDVLGGVTQKTSLFCDGKFYEQSSRSIFRTEEIGVRILGTLKISFSSGRMQLVDATGSVDIMLDLPPTWDFDRIFEAKDFIVVMEGMHQRSFDLNSDIDQPLSCRSIFSNAPLVKRTKTSLYLYHDPRDEDARSDSLLFDRKRNFKEIGSGKYHLFMLTHKFPFRKKGYQTDQSNMFAQAIVLPWDLLISGKPKDAVLNRCQWRDSWENFTSHKRCKIDLVSKKASYGLVNTGNELSGHFSGSSSSNSNSCGGKSCVSNDLLEIPCLIACKGLNSHYPSVLHCTSEYTTIISGCKPPRSKVLLEFGPSSFCSFEVLKVGCCYLFEHQGEDKLCSAKKNYKFGGAKVFIDPGAHLWSLNFSSVEGHQSSDVSDGFSSLNLQSSSENVIPKGFRIPSLDENGMGSEIDLDINVCVAAGALNSLLSVIRILENNSFEPKDSFKEESDICDHRGAMINTLVPSSGLSCVDSSLPVGNLITFHGLVLGLHECDCNGFLGQSRFVPGEVYMPMFLQGNSGVCIHLLVENCMVKVLCDLSKLTHPIGLGRDASATFHRVLVLSGLNKYAMMPVSFITINDIGLVREQCRVEFRVASASVGLATVDSPNTVSIKLISDVLQLSLLEPRQFCSRVVAVYLLVVEKTRTAKILQSSVHSRLFAVGIPLAGFIMDDGSSCCCCWFGSEIAATLLGLNSEEYKPEASAKNIGNAKTGTGLRYRSNVHHLNQILEQHGSVVMKNYGSIVDSSCQDLAISVGSHKLITSSDEDMLTSLAVSPLSTFWTVSGSVMDQEACRLLQNRLTELGMALPPLPNVQATNVCHTDMLAQARHIFQELA